MQPFLGMHFWHSMGSTTVPSASVKLPHNVVTRTNSKKSWPSSPLSQRRCCCCCCFCCSIELLKNMTCYSCFCWFNATIFWGEDDFAFAMQVLAGLQGEDGSATVEILGPGNLSDKLCFSGFRRLVFHVGCLNEILWDLPRFGEVRFDILADLVTNSFDLVRFFSSEKKQNHGRNGSWELRICWAATT